MILLTRLDAFWRRPAAYWPTLLLLAAATPLTFAPYYRFWLMPLLFAALIRLLELRSTVQKRSVYLFALTAYTTQFYWIHTALHDVSGLPNLYALPLTLLLPAYLALWPLAAVAVWQRVQGSRALRIGLALPVLWTLAEFGRERLMTGFGWGALGYSQIADGSPLAGFAPLGGIHLTTLATAFCGAWLVLLVDTEGRLKQRAAWAAALLLLLATGYAAKQHDFTTPAEPATVALAQGNIEQHLKFQPDQVVPTLQRYFEQITRSRADIVILPETAIPVMRQELPPEVLQDFADRARQNGSALAVGLVQYASDGRNYLNAMLNLSDYTPQNAGQAQVYAKNHLVPFGEYKPLPWLTEPLYRLMNMPLSDFQRGGTAQAPFHMGRQQVAFNICYEDGFGDELIASARQATLLANASNMAWYGHSNAMYQQLQQSQARALELGRDMVRATNTGATAIVDYKGRILVQAPVNTPYVLSGTVTGRQGETPYMRLGGSWPLIGLLALIAVLLLRPYRIPSERRPSEK